jgi:DNA-binding NarL/FixJ family response regulator
VTPRQQQVLKLIAEGYSTREIAHSLKISVKTVESHRTHLMERLNIHDIAGLVRYAIRMGVVEIEGYNGTAEHRTSSRAG